MFIDRDYKPDQLFSGIIEEAQKDKLRIKVWSHKEIENYLLDPKLIHSYIENRAGHVVAYAEVESLVNAVVSGMAEELPVLIADGYQTADRKLALPTAMKMAKELIRQRREVGAPWESLIGGKKALSMVSARLQEQWGVQLSPMSLCRHMALTDVPAELVEAVEMVV